MRGRLTVEEAREADAILDKILTWLTAHYASRKDIADALNVDYQTVAHWFSHLAYPSFYVMLKILEVMPNATEYLKNQ